MNLRRATRVMLLGIAACCACQPRRAPAAWEAVRVPTDAMFEGVCFTDSLHGWVTGGGWDIAGGIAGRTRDGGRSWTFDSGIIEGAPKGTGLGRVTFRDSLHGVVIARHGSALLTDDGGVTWRAPSGPVANGGEYSAVQFLDEREGWLAGTSIAHTSDGGETWQTVFRSSSENGYMLANAIQFLDSSHGWLASQGGEIARTEDGGAHWTVVPSPLPATHRTPLRSLSFSDPAHGWVVGDDGVILHTEDGGQSWALQTNGVPIVRTIPPGEAPRPKEPVKELEIAPDRLALTAVAFADPLTGWAIGSCTDVAESVILHTRDAGATWEVEHIQRGEMLRTLFVLDAGHVWATGDRARTAPQVILRRVAEGR